MTFPHFPHSSSSDDDGLDQALNAWASGDQFDAANTHAADAIELHRWASSALGSDPAATGPAAGTWNRVLRNSAQASPKGKREMTTAVLRSQSAGYAEAPRESVGQSIRRYSNLPATIALVLAVAIGGCLAMLQLNQPGGGSEPRFAALWLQPGQAGNGVCDVESLTVDEAIQIVRNPMLFLYGDEYDAWAAGMGELADDPALTNFIGAPLRDWNQLTGLTPHAALPVAKEEFTVAHQAAEEYRDCLQVGTRGQMWALVDPVVVQFEIASRIPLLQPMEETRATIERLLAEPNVASTNLAANDLQWRAYPEADLAVRVDHGITLHTSRSIIIPILFLNADGEVVASYDIYGNRIHDGRSKAADPGNIVVAYSDASRTWYVVGSYEVPQPTDDGAN